MQLDTRKYCYGIRDVLYAIDSSAVLTLIVFENLDINRIVVCFLISTSNASYSLHYSHSHSHSLFWLYSNGVKVATSTGDKVMYLTPSQEKNSSHFKDPETNADLEIKEKTSYVDWLAEHYKGMGFSLQFVTDSSQEGSQFVKGFGGIGCLLRFVVDFAQLDAQEDADEGKEREADSYDDDADYDYIY